MSPVGAFHKASVPAFAASPRPIPMEDLRRYATGAYCGEMGAGAFKRCVHNSSPSTAPASTRLTFPGKIVPIGKDGAAVASVRAPMDPA